MYGCMCLVLKHGWKREKGKDRGRGSDSDKLYALWGKEETSLRIENLEEPDWNIDRRYIEYILDWGRRLIHSQGVTRVRRLLDLDSSASWSLITYWWYPSYWYVDATMMMGCDFWPNWTGLLLSWLCWRRKLCAPCKLLGELLLHNNSIYYLLKRDGVDGFCYTIQFLKKVIAEECRVFLLLQPTGGLAHHLFCDETRRNRGHQEHQVGILGVNTCQDLWVVLFSPIQFER